MVLQVVARGSRHRRAGLAGTRGQRQSQSEILTIGTSGSYLDLKLGLKLGFKTWV
jgi:hypothetical protein